MTVQEAKKQIVYCEKYSIYTPSAVALQIAIKCMEEVEQYRALGTVEELKEALEKQKSRREWYQKGYQDGLNADKWIPCEVEMPKEHESMFAKFKGTNKWSGGMFEKTSDEVNVTIELDDGSIITRTTHTIDGKWSVEINSWVKQKVIAWQPLPAPYKKEGAEDECN
jgi:hypothetical protein